MVQYGKQVNGTQRYRCNNRDCPRTIFLLQYQDKGRLPAVRQQIVDMTLNGSGVRDIVRVLRVSSATVIGVLKKKEDVSDLLITCQTDTPNSYRLIKRPITKSCMCSVLEKQIVRRTNRLIRVRELMCLLSIFWVFSFPT